MLGGKDQTKVTLKHAREMLASKTGRPFEHGEIAIVLSSGIVRVDVRGVVGL